MKTPTRFCAVICLSALLSVSLVYVSTAPSPDARSLTCEAGGVFSQIVETVSGWFKGGDEDAETPEPVLGRQARDDDAFFSKNPLTYVAAFWTEIVNAPDDRTFMQRILAFLEAVRREQ
ncbi:MAG: hypothetical protein U9R40_03960 [Synergistota bacterium]|nr:hypothetical protein [Synergistota bacterium]